jgi:hypothetical protein
MPSRVWLAVAFLIGFGAPPARAETNGPATTTRAPCSPDAARAAEWDFGPVPFAEAGGRDAAAQ